MRTKQGIVTSAKMTGTVTVTVHRSVFHPMYKKRFRSSKKFLADSAGLDIGVGDLVTITECRPLSKNKHFKVTEIVQAAPRVSELVEESALAGVMKPKKPTNPTKPTTSDSSVSSESSDSSSHS